MDVATHENEQAVDSSRRSFFASLFLGVMGAFGLSYREAQAGPPPGRGRMGSGNRMGGGRMGSGNRGGRRGMGTSDPGMGADQTLIQTLLNGRSHIRRQIKMLPNGVETLTETDNPQLRTVLVKHVRSMKQRVEQVRPIHLRDPLFAALFQNARKVSMMKITETPRGVHVIETSNDPDTAKLIQAHAQVVSLFVRNGHLEVRKNHPVPPRS